MPNTIVPRKRIVEEHERTPIWQLVPVLEQQIDGMTQPGTFKRLYWQWYKNHIDCILLEAFHKIPSMVRVLRDTEDMVEFGMIIRFLSDNYSISRLTLAYVLYELPLKSEEEE